MARVVGVHGINQQVKGPDVLASTWSAALRDGVRLAGFEPPATSDVVVAFYGDLFRRPGKGLGDPLWTAGDVDDPIELELLTQLWLGAAEIDPAVPGASTPSKVRTPMLVQRALNALSNSAFFAGVAEHLVIGVLKQVRAYMTDEVIRAEAQARVVAAVGPDTTVLVGHSLGSVVAYEAACAHPEWSLTLVTIGSPLGIRNVVFDRLRPAPGHYPASVRAWTNIADRGDVVALAKTLAPSFPGGPVHDELVHNGAKSHDVSPYLTAVETGRAIGGGLRR